VAPLGYESHRDYNRKIEHPAFQPKVTTNDRITNPRINARRAGKGKR